LLANGFDGLFATTRASNKERKSNMLWYHTWLVKSKQIPRALGTDRRIGCTGHRDDKEGQHLDMNSFLYPLMKNLKVLAIQGVPTRLGPGISSQVNLRAHLIMIMGDMPTIAKVSITSSSSYSESLSTANRKVIR
jgi:hypothetical protein